MRTLLSRLGESDRFLHRDEYRPREGILQDARARPLSDGQGAIATSFKPIFASLRHLGVKPMHKTPFFYRMAPSLLTTAATIQVVGETLTDESKAVARKQGR